MADPDAFAAALAEAVCAKLAACGCSAVPDTCVADRTAATLAYNEVFLAAGNVFDPVCARRAVLWHEWASCGLDTASPCDACRVFVGTLAEGDACERIPDLVDPCGHDLFCNDGRCTGPLPMVDEGATCREDGDLVGSCGPDLSCDFFQHICVARPTVGEPCRVRQCDTELWCDTSDSATGVCRARLPGGDPCSGEFQCESFVCAQGVCSGEPRYCYRNH
ncbi:hypothetical protein [Nannocystis pusilla]|uniref:hypothetical protein n=1 Tax=Nannocystis pusilla TaxID=889268 RepID=UPI003B7F7976